MQTPSIFHHFMKISHFFLLTKTAIYNRITNFHAAAYSRCEGGTLQ